MTNTLNNMTNTPQKTPLAMVGRWLLHIGVTLAIGILLLLYVVPETWPALGRFPGRLAVWFVAGILSAIMLDGPFWLLARRKADMRQGTKTC